MLAWKIFYSAKIGASAALAGLVLVSASINPKRIVSSPPLPSRVLEALIILFVILIASSLALTPQPTHFFGTEILFVGAAAWLITSKLHLDYRRAAAGRYVRQTVALAAVGQLATMPYLLGGVCLISSDEAGNYLLLVGILAGFAVAFTNSWILLVEINRSLFLRKNSRILASVHYWDTDIR